MAFIFNGNEPRKITFNNKNVAKLKYNDTVVWETLPSTYTRLEYIQSTRSQYINTKLKIFSYINHEIIIDFMPTLFYNYNTIWGSTYDADTFESWIYLTGSLASRYNNIRYGTDTLITVNTRHLLKVKKENNTLSNFVDGVAKGTGSSATNLKDSDFLLFLSGSDYGAYRLYDCKLYCDGELKRNFIPCYRNSDEEIGLYDLVNDVFYTNVGTGSFIAGPEI